MFCRHCGNELPDDSIFCSKCGHKLSDDTNSVMPPSDEAVSSTPPADDSPGITPANDTQPQEPIPLSNLPSNPPSHSSQKGLWVVIIAVIGGLTLLLVYLPLFSGHHSAGSKSTVKQEQKSPEQIAAEKKAKEEKAAAEKKAHEEAIKPPVTMSRAIVTADSIGQPELGLIMSNNSKKTIDAFKIRIYAYDNYGAQLKQFGIGDEFFSGISQREIAPGASTSSDYKWTLHGFENGRKFKVQLRSVHFSDDSEWTAEKDQDVSIECKFNPNR